MNDVVRSVRPVLLAAVHLGVVSCGSGSPRADASVDAPIADVSGSGDVTADNTTTRQDVTTATDTGRPRDRQREPLACNTTWSTQTLGGMELRERLIDPRCTDPAIDSCPSDGERCLESKDHLVVQPVGTRRGLLWVHFGGSGGAPQNASNISRVAASLGYASIGLAFMNEPSVADRCTDPVTRMARPEVCEGLVRTEILYGNDTTPWTAVDRVNSIEHRLLRLLAQLHREDASRGWDAFFTESALRWDRIAVSGFSQGGGMAGMISRDHSVARAVYFSKGAGSTAVVGAACARNEDCPTLRCCAVGDEECETTPASGGRCVSVSPVEWARTGARGVGGPAQRATPGSRMYAIYHRREFAALYSPAVFELWGMGAPTAAVDGDRPPPYGSARVFNTGLAPCAGGSTHGSIGSNGAQPKRGGCGGDVPAMIDVWRHMMSHE